MNTFLNALHVVAAVLLTGPLVVAPFAARWAIRRRSQEGVRLAANIVAVFGAGSVLVAGLGVATLLTSDEWTPTTPWVLISATLFVVALGLTWGYAVPALRSAVTLVGAELTPAAPSAPPAGDGDGDGDGEGDSDGDGAAESDTPPARATTAEDQAEEIRRRYRLDSIAARVTGAGWLLLIAFGAITVLMTTRPFG